MIKLQPVQYGDKLHNAFGINDKQAATIRNEVCRAFETARTWTDCIEQSLKETDTPLEEAFKILLIGKLIGIAT